MTEILANFEDYILNENNMINYLKYKITSNSNDNKQNKLKERNIIQTMAITFLRGFNLRKSVVLLDEAQNISHLGMKLVLTRIAESKYVIFSSFSA